MKIILDANLIVSLVLPLPYSEAAAARFMAWKRGRAALAAPALWRYEVNSVLRKALVTGYLSSANHAAQALASIWQLNIEDVPATFELQQQALAWAGRLGQVKTYDSAYLAAAEALNAEFWTADLRLAQAARQAGATWVRLIFDGDG